MWMKLMAMMSTYTFWYRTFLMFCQMITPGYCTSCYFLHSLLVHVTHPYWQFLLVQQYCFEHLYVWVTCFKNTKKHITEVLLLTLQWEQNLKWKVTWLWNTIVMWSETMLTYTKDCLGICCFSQWFPMFIYEYMIQMGFSSFDLRFADVIHYCKMCWMQFLYYENIIN
jgi:hypothetical protein